ncbi:NUDIX domain-containing protein [Dyadobacter bucti]|uniref:NUDIX domain-containing protein n=1 Tax=Dyadobacter bucti TaxID=2572203 RepID=UPI001108AB99|nr:NUDIX domain-containing protein [Dyadobacter bucti]
MKQSAGILLFRVTAEEPEVLLVHPGGPFFAKKNEGSWTIPKGEGLPSEDLLETAVREFEEETGASISGAFIPLNPITQKGGKRVFCWALEGNLDLAMFVSNTFEMEWPPKSGKMKSYPENDKAAWLKLGEAKKLINEKQLAFLEQLAVILDYRPEH